jgi:hypothetical protein
VGDETPAQFRIVAWFKSGAVAREMDVRGTLPDEGVHSVEGGGHLVVGFVSGRGAVGFGAAFVVLQFDEAGSLGGGDGS